MKVQNATAIDVSIRHCNQQLKVCRLSIGKDRRIAWQYDAQLLDHGLAVSPLQHPLTRDTFRESVSYPDSSLYGLPGFIADALPDSWGQQLMRAALSSAGLQHINILDQLAWQGDRAIGALEFLPIFKTDRPQESLNAWDLKQLQLQTQAIHTGTVKQIHDQIKKAGGSAGGAFPKYAVGLNKSNELALAPLPKHYRPVILKTPAWDIPIGHEYTRIEYCYAEMARRSGITVPNTQLLFQASDDDQKGRAWYAIDRFDRVGENYQAKLHQCTLAGLLNREFRSHTTSAEEALAACRVITNQHLDVVELFRRIVFNYLGHNCDDHAKNISFQFDENNEWRLAPWYDGAWCQNDGGHAMPIDGWPITGKKARFDKLAKQMGIRKPGPITEQVAEALGQWQTLAEENGIADEKANEINTMIQQHINGL